MREMIAVNIRDKNHVRVYTEFVEDTEDSLEELRDYWLNEVAEEVRDDGELYWTMNWSYDE